MPATVCLQWRLQGSWIAAEQRPVGRLGTQIGTMDNPRDIGEALSGVMQGHYWKHRVGDWRIICDCDIEDDRIVVRVLRRGNRRERYR